MGKSSKKDKKDKRHKDKSKSSKKRKHYSDSSDSDSDVDARKRAKAERLAQKVASQLKRDGAPGDDDAPDAGAGKFVWHKKIEKQILDGAKVKDLTIEAERKRHRERQEEIEKVQKRRLEREQEKAAMEEELAMIQRQRAHAEAVELEAKEEVFHLEQAVQRSQQRLRDGRPQPIDALVRTLHLGAEFDLDAEEPYQVLAGLLLREMQELRDDMDEFVELDTKDPEHADFWKAMVTVTDHALLEATYQEEVDQARVRGLPPPPHPQGGVGGVHKAVEQDVHVMLSGKTLAELVELEDGIHAQLQSGEAADPEYWSAVLDSMTLHKAKARLREIHRRLLQQQVAQLTSLNNVDVPAVMGWAAEGDNAANGSTGNTGDDGRALQDAVVDATLQDALGMPAGVPVIGEEEEVEEDNHGQWSPAPLDLDSVAGQELVTQQEDEELLELLRAQVRAQQAAALRKAMAGAVRAPAPLAERDLHEAAARGATANPMMRNLTDAAPQEGDLAMRSGRLGEPEDQATRQFKAVSTRAMGDLGDSGDAPFTGDVALESQVYWWHEKYKPRKPKYFNRVHTGYEWNRYNQAHYDSDNPPPKAVQGYKFNIFYPDLIDKAKTPTYHVERDPTSPDGSTCLVRFRAGPPYEDIAFRVVNKEWEYNHKKGFVSTFERGILQLYFNFKRQRYRR